MHARARAVTGRRSRGADMSAPCLDSERSRPTQWTQPDGSPAGLVAFAFGARYEGRLHAVDGADAVGTESSV